jgi:hypothetical protein
MEIYQKIADYFSSFGIPKKITEEGVKNKFLSHEKELTEALEEEIKTFFASKYFDFDGVEQSFMVQKYLSENKVAKIEGYLQKKEIPAEFEKFVREQAEKSLPSKEEEFRKILSLQLYEDHSIICSNEIISKYLSTGKENKMKAYFEEGETGIGEFLEKEFHFSCIAKMSFSELLDRIDRKGGNGLYDPLETEYALNGKIKSLLAEKEMIGMHSAKNDLERTVKEKILDNIEASDFEYLNKLHAIAGEFGLRITYDKPECDWLSKELPGTIEILEEDKDLEQILGKESKASGECRQVAIAFS